MKFFELYPIGATIKSLNNNTLTGTIINYVDSGYRVEWYSTVNKRSWTNTWGHNALANDPKKILRFNRTLPEDLFIL